MNEKPKSPAEFFQPGAVVYFQKCHRQPKQKSDAMRTPNGMYAFGMLLGVVPPFVAEPTADLVFSICANFGMVTIDSIIELLGVDVANQYLAKLQAKFDALPAPEPQPQPSKLLGADGNPFKPKLPILVPGTGDRQ